LKVEALQREEQGSDGGGGAIEGHLPRVDERYYRKGAELRDAAAKDEADREQRRAAAEAEATRAREQAAASAAASSNSTSNTNANDAGGAGGASAGTASASGGAGAAAAARPPRPVVSNTGVQRVLKNLVDFRWVDESKRWAGVCVVCKGTFEGWVSKTLGKFDEYNTKDHLKSHSNGLGDAFWAHEKLKVADGDGGGAGEASARDMLAKALTNKWSVKDLIEAAFHGDQKKKFGVAPYLLEWFVRVADLVRELAMKKRENAAIGDGGARKKQTTLDVVKQSRMDEKMRLCNALLVHVVVTNSSFRSIESGGINAALKIANPSFTARASRKTIAQQLPLMHSYVLKLLESDLRSAVSFSICFDLWSSRRLKNSFIALIFRWVDRSGRLREDIFDLIHMGGLAHSANAIAVLIARRIDAHADNNQFLMGTMTDNARNVILASKRLVFQLGLILRHDREIAGHAEAAGRALQDSVKSALEAEADELRSVAATAERLQQLQEQLDDGADDDDVDPALLLDDLEEIETARIGSCAIHSVMLAINKTVDTCDDLKAAVDKADVITTAVLRSTKLQHAFADLQRIAQQLKPTHDECSLVRRAPTRWHSLHSSAQSIVLNGDVLQAMSLRGAFDKCQVDVQPLSDNDLIVLGDIVTVLTPVKVIARLLECRDIMMTPMLPFLVGRLLRDLKAMVDRPPNNSAAIKRFARVLHDDVYRRLGKHMTDSNQPSLMCALLAPWCGTRGLLALGVDEAVVTATVGVLYKWCEDLTKWRARNDSERRSSSAPITNPLLLASQIAVEAANAASSTEAIVARMMYASVVRVVEANSGDTAAPVPPLKNEHFWSVDDMRKLSQQISDYYYGAGVEDRDVLATKDLVSALTTLGGASAVAEQALSTTGRNDAALRSKLAPAKLEMLTVVGEYLTRNSIDVEKFLAEFESEHAIAN
jgi:hypothetical protein